MPFTLSHAAAALPFRRRPLVAAAVVAGTLVPDVVLFASLGPSYDATHSLRGVFTWDVLMALVVLAAWYAIFREPVLALLPVSLSARVPPRPRWRGQDVLWVPVSAALGAATHVLWDSFTHHRAVAIWGWQWLGARVVGGLPVFGVLQYLSSAAGLAILVLWSATRPRLSPLPARPLVPAARVAVIALALAVGFFCSIAYAWEGASSGLVAMVYRGVVGSVAGSALVIAGYATARGSNHVRRGSAPVTGDPGVATFRRGRWPPALAYDPRRLRGADALSRLRTSGRSGCRLPHGGRGEGDPSPAGVRGMW